MNKREKLFFIVVSIVLIFGVELIAGSPQDFDVKKISDRVLVLRNPADNVSQLAVVSQKGIVVLDTFWSTITANKFRRQWEKVLNRDDFVYTINTVDRLDIFGGNGTYKETIIIGHQTFWEKFDKKAVTAEINRLIKMWRRKEDVSRKRLPTHKPGSKEEKGEKKWLKTCKQTADELESGFSFVLPHLVYNDRMEVNLGDLTIQLISFGRAGYDGMSIVVVPEEKVAVLPGFILHSQHLAPHPNSNYVKLDVPRWIAILEEILDDAGPVEKIICWTSLWTKKRAQSHLYYIKTLWNKVAELEAAGMDIQTIQKKLSLDTDFSFVKKMKVYQEHGDDWVRPQHRAHVRGFFLQYKKLASELVKKEMKQLPLKEALKKVLVIKAEDNSIFIDESSMNGLGYQLLGSGKVDDALEIFKVIVEMYPQSANAYDSLAEAFMEKGDKKSAIKNYKKSLKLNPKNENAKKMIKKLKKK